MTHFSPARRIPALKRTALNITRDGSAVDFTYKLPFKLTDKIDKVTVGLNR
jgi:hypothetical protein